ncbi:MAG: hypothetical protein KAT30_08935, partial [Candidatus Krumholzibacteria bacterium]|nr:hypothetical protein [Candidatus Krumholzibacteria bacterium]
MARHFAVFLLRPVRVLPAVRPFAAMLCAGAYVGVCALVVATLAPSVCAEPADSTTSPLDTVYTVAPIVIEAPRVPLHVDDVFLRS